MAERELISESEDSDDDYVPEGENGNVSEESNSGVDESDVDDETNESVSKKRRKLNSEPEPTKKSSPEKSNLNIDAVWADFKKEVDEPKAKIAEQSETTEPVKGPDVSKPKTLPKPRFNSLANSSKGGLSSILGNIGKKDKLSTLEKSKLDWNNFKRSEGIEDELKSHNKGKDGYLERRDFLERTDLRQFEIEKQLRTVSRSNR